MRTLGRTAYPGAVTVLVLLPDGADESSDREADAVFEALSPAQRDGLVVARQVPYRLPAPPARLGGCDILHISGRYDELVGNEDWLVAVCQQASPLLVYCSCYADGSEPHDAANGEAPEVTSTAAGFPNLAAILQREAGIPVALSLEGRTTRASLSTAADEFYRGLAGGLPTPAAVARARRQVALALEPGHAAVAERLLDWAGLVLYQSDEHGLLLTEAGLVSTAAEPATAIRGDEEPAQRSARMMKNGAPDPFGSLARRDVQRWSVKPRRRALGGIATGPGEGQAALLSSLARALGESASQGESDDAVLDRVRAGLSTHPVEEKTLDLLREALRSDDRRRQVAAVEALGLIGGGQPAARDILVMLVAGPECGTVAPIVRHTAIRQLGRIADQPAIEALLLTMVDPDQEVRELARQALAHASRSAGATLGQARIRLPLQSVEAMRWVAPLRRAIANDKDLPPRQRVDKMAEVEALRLELIRPRPRPSRLGALFENLDGMSPEIKSLVLDLKKRIEWGVPGGERLDPRNAASLASGPGFDGGGAR